MIDHISIGVKSLKKAKEFYDAALKPLGYTCVYTVDIPGEGMVAHGYGEGQKPSFWIGKPEKLEALEDFHADRIAGRILGMGDIVSLVEKAIETTEAEEAERLAKKMQKGEFDLNDLASQLRQLQKMGGLASIAGMLPGIGKMQKQLEGRVDDKVIRRSLAIISSMTPKERRNPDLIKASRKNRIAKGCGMQVQDINKLLKQHMEMARMMKQVSKLGQKGLMRSGMAALMKGGAGGMTGGGFPPFGGRR